MALDTMFQNPYLQGDGAKKLVQRLPKCADVNPSSIPMNFASFEKGEAKLDETVYAPKIGNFSIRGGGDITY